MKSIVFIAVIFCQAAIAQTKQDTAAIKEAAANYVGGFYANDFKRIEKSVHAELAKRIVLTDSVGGTMIRNMGLTELSFNAKKFKKPDDASGIPFKVDVLIYDISHGIATAKVAQNKMKFFDYIQLGKVDGEWKIVNVLWARTE